MFAGEGTASSHNDAHRSSMLDSGDLRSYRVDASRPPLRTDRRPQTNATREGARHTVRQQPSASLETLYELQACFHHLCVKHEIPHHETIATIAIGEKSENERKALCLDMLTLLRSICDNVPCPNPLLPLSVQPLWSDCDSDADRKEEDDCR